MATLTPYCCPIWPLSVTLDQNRHVIATPSPLPRVPITAMATNLSPGQPARHFSTVSMFAYKDYVVPCHKHYLKPFNWQL